MFDVSPARDGARIDFRHRGMNAELACYDQCRPGWDRALGSFARYLETGSGTPAVAVTDAMLSA